MGYYTDNFLYLREGLKNLKELRYFNLDLECNELGENPESLSYLPKIFENMPKLKTLILDL